jgi:hypothetical protein
MSEQGIIYIVWGRNDRTDSHDGANLTIAVSKGR